MNDEDDIEPEVRQWLSDLSREDIHTLRAGLPLIRMVIGFGKVTRWLVLTVAGIFLGGVMLWDGMLKILAWLRGSN